MKARKHIRMIAICTCVFLLSLGGIVCFGGETAEASPSYAELLAQSVNVTSHADLVARINAVPANGTAVFALPTGGITGGNGITVNGGKQITLISQSATIPAVYTQATSGQRHFIVTAANSRLTLYNVTLDGAWTSGTVQRGGVRVEAAGRLELLEGSKITRCAWNSMSSTTMAALYANVNLGSAVRVAGTGSFLLIDGGFIEYNVTNKSSTHDTRGAVVLYNGAQAEMHSGGIRYNRIQGSGTGNGIGSAVSTFYGTDTRFTMYGGEISGNITDTPGPVFAPITLYSGTFEMYGGVIEGNETRGANSSGGGGAVYLSFADSGARAQFIMHDGAIRGNLIQQSTGYGGVICVYSGMGSYTATVTINGGVIENNRVTGTSGVGHGGAIMMRAGVTVNITGGVIRNNEAVGGIGGGIYQDAGTLNISGGTISGNRAGTTGGGIHRQAGVLNITGGTIINNTAATAGGGIYNSTGTLNISNATISNNTASMTGGGIHVQAGAFSLTNTTITGNTSTSHGGGVNIVPTASVTVRDSTISGNRANSTGQGGGIRATGPLVFERVNMDRNHANGDGGGIFATTISGNTLYMTSNSSGTSGGGLYLSGAGNTVTDLRLIGNSAVTSGGGMRVMGTGTTNLTTANISSNTAGTTGGGMNIEGSVNVTINGMGTINNNRAAGNGGGLYLTGVAPRFSMVAGDISGNYASNGGGAYLPNTDNAFTLQTGTMRDNMAANNGGAIYTERRGMGSRVYAPAFNNINTGSTVRFINNSANEYAVPPENAATLTYLGFASSSLFNHILNNYDVNFQENICVKNHAELLEAINSVPANNMAEIGLHNDFAATGNTITISGGRKIMLTSCKHALGRTMTYTQDRSGQRHFIVTGAGSSLTLQNVTLDGGWYSGTVQRGGVRVEAGARLELLEGSKITRCAWNSVSGTTINALYANVNLGSAVRVAGAGSFLLIDGGFIEYNVTNKSSTHDTRGAVVLYNGAQAEMHSGGIRYNRIQGSGTGNGIGAAVSMHSGMDTRFTMYGGEISGNITDTPGPVFAPITLYSGTFEMYGGVIEGNETRGATSSGGGGAIYLSWAASSAHAQFIMHDGAIRGNLIQQSTGYGGVICVYSGMGSYTATVTINGGVIENNRVTGTSGVGHGGAIMMRAGVTVNITGGVIRNNEAVGGMGGGIYHAGGTLNITGGTISGNIAGGHGGGINSVPATGLTIRDATISGNHANGTGQGGGIRTSGPLVLERVIVDGNQAVGDGGGIFATTVSGSNVDVLRNTTGGTGGGLRLSGGNNTLTNVNLIGNTAVGSGGGLRVVGAGTTNLTNADISNNTAGTTGGGLQIEGGTQVFLLSYGTVNNNKAVGNGGGVYLIGNGSRFTFAGGSISGNSATDGGGIYTTNIDNSIIINSGTLRDNHASGDGGAIFTERRSWGTWIPPGVAWGNVRTTTSTIFEGNRASTAVQPPENYTAFTYLQSSNASIYAHILNNYDINFQRGICVRTHAELLAAVNAIPVGGNAEIAIRNDFPATGNTIMINGGRQVTLTSCDGAHGCGALPNNLSTYTQTNASQRHFIVSGAGSGLTLKNVVLDGAWISGMVNRGGVRVLQGGELVMERDSMITGAFWRNQEGGAVHLVDTGSSFVMWDGVLQNNFSLHGGGGVSVMPGTSVTMHDGIIRTNRGANNGVGQHSAGGIFVTGVGASATMYGGIIADNQALLEASTYGLSAGGVHVANGGHFDLYDGTIRNNTSFTGDAGNAGGLHVVNATAIMRDGLIEENVGHSSTNGEGTGGIHVSGGGQFELRGGIIRYNTGTSVSGNTAGGVGISNRASGNTANNTGTGNSLFTMYDGLITGNTAGRQGGGVAILQRSGYPSAASTPRFRMEGGQITENHAGTIARNTSATAGGGVSVNTTENNTGAHFLMENGAIIDNEAGTHGGGVYVTATTNGVNKDARFVMTGGTLSGNRATIHGGGAYVAQIASPAYARALTILDGVVADNTAGFDGGGIYAEPREVTAFATALQNIETGASVQFSGNTASLAFEPPTGASALTNIKFATTSIHGHAINNYDIVFRDLVIETIHFTFTKIDESLYRTSQQIQPLAGATFTLYFFDEVRFQALGGGDGTVDHTLLVTQAGIDLGIWKPVQESLTTGPSGQLDVFLELFTETPIHQLVERNAPDGYLLPYGQWRISVVNPHTGMVRIATRGAAPDFIQIGGTYYVGNEPITTPVPFTFIKTDERLYESVPNAAPLAGAVFELYQWNAEVGCTIHAEMVTAAGIAHGHGCWSLVGTQSSGKDGRVTFDTLYLEMPIYQLVERAAPWGFETPAGQWRVMPNPDTGRVDVMTKGDALAFVIIGNEYHVGNIPIPRGNFAFIKEDEAGVPLPGAHFSLCRFIPRAGSEPYADLVTLEGMLYGYWELMANVESGADGRVEFELQAGRYNLIETIAPYGMQRPTGQWQIDMTDGAIIQIRVVGDAPAIALRDGMYRLVNRPKEYQLDFTKTDDLPTPTALPDARFSLYRYTGPADEDMTIAEIQIPEPVDSDEFIEEPAEPEIEFRLVDTVSLESIDTGYWTLWETAVSGSDGRVILPLDDQAAIYQLVETKAPDGFELPAGQWRILFDPDTEEMVTFVVGFDAEDFVIESGGTRILKNMPLGWPVRFVLNYCDDPDCDHDVDCRALKDLFLVQKVPDGRRVERPATDPVRPGYIFLGWHTDPEAESLYDFAQVITGERSLYAHWEASDIQVVFDKNDKSAEPETATYGIKSGNTYEDAMTDAQVVALTQRPGYTFIGWYTQPTGGVRVYPDQRLVNGNPHTLYARWSLNVITMNFWRNDDAEIRRRVVLDIAAEDYVLAMSDPAVIALTLNREHFDFKGWYTEAEGGYRVYPTTPVISFDAHALYAHWVISESLVTFIGNGGTPTLQTETINNGETTIAMVIARVIEPTWNGHSFLYWSLKAGGDPVDVDKIVDRENDLVLYARWTPNSVFTIEITAIEGDEDKIEDVMVEGPGVPDFEMDAAGLVTIVVRPEGDGIFDEYTEITVTIPPDWEIVAGPDIDDDGNIVVVIRKEGLSVTYLPGDGTGLAYVDQVAHSETWYEFLAFDETDIVAPDGYAFIGWRLEDEVIQPSDEIRITADITVTAMFGQIFTVTFHLYDGSGDYFAIQVIDGNSLVLDLLPDLEDWYSEAPATPGYVLRGWYTDEVLDASGRIGAGGRRRPLPLTVVAEDTNFDLTTPITAALFPPGETNFDLYAIWGLWGDVNGDDEVNLADLVLLQEYLAMFPVTIIKGAANVVRDYNGDEPNVTLSDLVLLQEYLAMFPVVLGQPP